MDVVEEDRSINDFVVVLYKMGKVYNGGAGIGIIIMAICDLGGRWEWGSAGIEDKMGKGVGWGVEK